RSGGGQGARTCDFLFPLAELGSSMKSAMDLAQREKRMNRWTRRQLLQVGGISALGLGLPELLHARAPDPGSRRQGPEQSCLFIVEYGGASPHDSWALKPDAPQDIRGPYRPIATNVPGMRIGELLPRLARLADRYCLVRSMTHGNGGHDGGMHVCMTGHS